MTLSTVDSTDKALQKPAYAILAAVCRTSCEQDDSKILLLLIHQFTSLLASKKNLYHGKQQAVEHQRVPVVFSMSTNRAAMYGCAALSCYRHYR
jgi:hypothetical protein